MKATSGNLRLDQKYTLEGQEYHGKFADGLIAGSCENCGMIITNVAIVRGSVDNHSYRIGLDCAATLTGIEPSAIAQAKKVLANKAKLLKFIKTDCRMGIIDDDGDYIALYTYKPRGWAADRRYEVRNQFYGETLKLAGITVKTHAELHAAKLDWIKANCSKAELSDDGKRVYIYDHAHINAFVWNEHDNATPDVLDAIKAAGVTIAERVSA